MFMVKVLEGIPGGSILESLVDRPSRQAVRNGLRSLVASFRTLLPPSRDLAVFGADVRRTDRDHQPPAPFAPAGFGD